MWRIINPYEMARAVRDNKVLYEEYVVYLLIFFISSSIIIPPRHVTPLSNWSIIYTIRILTILEVFLFLVVAYIGNKKGNATHFWYRSISILASMRIIIFAFFLLGSLSLYLSIPSLSLDGPRYVSWFPVIVYILYMAIFSMVMYKSIRIASSTPENILPHDDSSQSFYLAGKNIFRIINPYKMALAVREERVLKKEYISYAAIFAILFLGDIALTFSSVSPKNLPLQYTVWILTVLELFVPLVIAYEANKKGNNTHFWYRMVSINVPIVITVALVSLTLSLLFTTISNNILWSSAIKFSSNSWEIVPLAITSLFIHSVMVYHYMRIASSAPVVK